VCKAEKALSDCKQIFVAAISNRQPLTANASFRQMAGVLLDQVPSDQQVQTQIDIMQLLSDRQILYKDYSHVHRGL